MDILTDYAAIAVGTAQATTGKVIALGRAGASRVAGLGLLGALPAGLSRPHIGGGDIVRHGREAVSDLAHGDVHGAVGRWRGRQ